jgi:hypothetical protein
MARNHDRRHTAKRYLSDTESDAEYETDKDTSDTDITEPEIQNHIRSHVPDQGLGCGPEAPMVTYRRRYEDPADDTEEELSDIPSDFELAEGTKSLRTRIVDRWHRYTSLNNNNVFIWLTMNRYCEMKAAAAQESSGSIWHYSEDALRAASANCLYLFLNWNTKLVRGKNGRKLRRYTKANAFKSDWKYFRGYYQRVKGKKMDRDMARRLRAVR